MEHGHRGEFRSQNSESRIQDWPFNNPGEEEDEEEDFIGLT